MPCPSESASFPVPSLTVCSLVLYERRPSPSSRWRRRGLQTRPLLPFCAPQRSTLGRPAACPAPAIPPARRPGPHSSPKFQTFATLVVCKLASKQRANRRQLANTAPSDAAFTLNTQTAHHSTPADTPTAPAARSTRFLVLPDHPRPQRPLPYRTTSGSHVGAEGDRMARTNKVSPVHRIASYAPSVFMLCQAAVRIRTRVSEASRSQRRARGDPSSRSHHALPGPPQRDQGSHPIPARRHRETVSGRQEGARRRDRASHRHQHLARDKTPPGPPGRE